MHRTIVFNNARQGEHPRHTCLLNYIYPNDCENNVKHCEHCTYFCFRSTKNITQVPPPSAHYCNTYYIIDYYYYFNYYYSRH